MMLTNKHIAMLQRTAERYHLKLYPADDKSHVMICDESGNLTINYDGETFTFQDGIEAEDPLTRMKQFVTGAKTGMWLEGNATPALDKLLKGLGSKQPKK